MPKICYYGIILIIQHISVRFDYNCTQLCKREKGSVMELFIININ